MAKSFLVIGNWKMNPLTSSEAKKLWASIVKIAGRLRNTQVVLTPSFLHLPLFSISKGSIYLGAQDAFFERVGAFTGEVSADMLSESGVKYVILGHSERRALGETNEIVHKKVKGVLSAGLIPVVCIGEMEHDHQGKYLSFLRQQIISAFKGLSNSELSRVVVAYEPIWAIGKNAMRAITSHELHETVLYIQKILIESHGRVSADKVKIIYGGSVDSENAGELIKDGIVKGFLVGRASLSVETFSPILKAVDSARS